MNSWQEHQVEFAPTEGLQKNETSIRMLDNDIEDDNEMSNRLEARVEDLEDAEDGPTRIHIRHILTEEMKKDAGYKFLMMVSAFSGLRLGNVIDMGRRRFNMPDEGHICENTCGEPSNDNKWMEAPEITGVVQLSPRVYGHVKEAEMIVNNDCTVPLKSLVEHPSYSTAFARLVGIRIILSGVLTGLGNRRDASFKRLHQEQHMLLRSLRNIRPNNNTIPNNNTRDWTRPLR